MPSVASTTDAFAPAALMANSMAGPSAVCPPSVRLWSARNTCALDAESGDATPHSMRDSSAHESSVVPLSTTQG